MDNFDVVDFLVRRARKEPAARQYFASVMMELCLSYCASVRMEPGRLVPEVVVCSIWGIRARGHRVRRFLGNSSTWE
jgi:hypothetical protein